MNSHEQENLGQANTSTPETSGVRAYIDSKICRLSALRAIIKRYERDFIATLDDDIMVRKSILSFCPAVYTDLIKANELKRKFICDKILFYSAKRDAVGREIDQLRQLHLLELVREKMDLSPYKSENIYDYLAMNTDDDLIEFDDDEYCVGPWNVQHKKTYSKAECEQRSFMMTKKQLIPAVRDEFLARKLRFISVCYMALRLPQSVRLMAMRNYDDYAADLIFYGKVSYPMMCDCFDRNNIRMIDTDFFKKMIEDENERVFEDDALVTQRLHPIAQAQMEEPHGECEEVKIEQKENVVLVTHAKESKSEPIEIPKDNWERLCSSQNIKEYTSLMSRWQRYTPSVDLEWTKDDAQGKQILDLKLPRDLILADKDSPNNVLFKQYAYFKSDLEIRLIANTNKFHCGQLQASFYYGSDLDEHYEQRTNVYCASQMSHALLDAASSNDVVLTIPYRHYKPLMGTFDREGDTNALNLGALRVYVLNKLKVPKDDTNIVSLNLMYRYVNPSFHAMKDRDIGVINEMFGSNTMRGLVKDAANLVDQAFPDPQRDNPSDIIPAKPMVPWSSHSWSLGDVTPEPINPLRLQATGNTPHPPGTLPKEPEQSISYLVNTFGLVSTITWSRDNATGIKLFDMPFSPTWVYDKYPTQTVNTKSYAVMPPVSVMSQLFAYWRGSMEYRLDFISTQFHTGRLLIAYVPRALHDETKEPTLKQLTHCDHVVIDLRDAKQFSYVCNFVSDKPWWPRRKHTSYSAETAPPGHIYIYVLNRLTATTAVSSDIEINLYMRGGKDFELHIPILPNIGLTFNTDKFDKGEERISYLQKYGPPIEGMYVGKVGFFGAGAVFRWGAIGDRLTQFMPKTTHGNIYPWGTIFENKSSPVIPHPDSALRRLSFLVPFPSDNGNYVYGAAFETSVVAKLFAKTIKKTTLDNKVHYEYDITKMTQLKTQGGYLPSTERYYWEPVVESQGPDERRDVCGKVIEVQSPLLTTNNGYATFGEKIDNVKQLTRRYQPYGKFISLTTAVSNPAIADFCFPVMPQGLDLDVALNSDIHVEDPYANRFRDGVIPLIASAYRFYRGGVRFRFIVSSKEEGAFWVQHRPDFKVTKMTVSPASRDKTESIFMPGYAYFVQMTEINNVVEIEVPFYLPGQFGMLQRPKLGVEDSVHYSLGSLFCGFDTMKGTPREVPYHVQIFYSMGDDMSFSVFQGFPPMIDTITFLDTATVENQMFANVKEKFRNVVKDVVQSEVKEIKGEIQEAIIENTSSEPVASTSDESTPPTESSAIMDLIRSVCKGFAENKRQVIFGIVSQLIHALINPSLTTVVWCIGSVFLQLGLLAMNIFDKFITVCKRFLESFNNLRVKWANKLNPAQAVAQAPFDEETGVEAAFISTCVTGMLSLVGAVSKPLPKTLPNFASYLYDGLPKFTMTANGMHRFMTNTLGMFKRMWYWLVSYFKPEMTLASELDGSSDEVVTFVRRVQFCLDKRNYNQIRSDPEATLQVYECANIATSYLAKKSVSTTAKHLYLFERYCKDIIKLRDELVAEFISPPIRFEPFVICLTGASNVGKSHLAQTLAKELMNSINYRSFEEIVYTRTPGTAYWNGLRNQPVCLFDDFLCLEDSQFGLQQVGELFLLKSKGVFNPPMAAIEEKKLRYNPLAVLLCSNKDFVTLNGVGTPEAFHRRRDIMFKVSKKTAYKDKHPRTLSTEEKKTYAHLEFQRYIDPGDDKRAKDLLPVSSYGEMLSELIKEFHFYFNEECIQYDKCVNEMRQMFPDPTKPVTENLDVLISELEKINDRRVPQQEKNLIKEWSAKIKNSIFKSDFSTYVQTKVKEMKVAELISNTEVPVATSSSISTTVESQMEAESATNISAPKFNFKQLVNFPVEFQGVIRTCVEHIIIPHGKAIHDVDMDTVDKLLSKFITSVWKKYKEISKFDINICPCLIQVALSSDYDAEVNGNIGIFNYLIPSSAAGRFSGVMKYEARVNKPCPYEYCFMRNEELWSKCFNVALLKIPDYNCPQQVKELRLVDECLAGNNTLVLTQSTADTVVETISNKSWLKTMWEKIPSWYTIMKAIGMCAGLFAGIGVLIRSFGMVKDAIYSNKADESYSVAKVENAKELKEHIKEYWADPVTKVVTDMNLDYINANKLAEGPVGYSTETVGAKGSVIIAKALAQASNGVEAAVENFIVRNTFFVKCLYGPIDSRKVKMLRCLGLFRRNFIFLDHYAYFMNEAENLQLYYVKDNVEMVLPLECFGSKKFQNSALCIGTLTATFPEFRNIAKFIIPQSKSANISPKAYLLELKYIEGKWLLEKHSFERIIKKDSLEVNNDDGSTSIVSTCYSYPKSERGLCGSVLVANSSINAPILGIHVAGLTNNQTGYAEAIVYESFEKLMNQGGSLHANETKIISNMGLATDAKYVIQGNVISLGSVPKSSCVSLSKKTRLIPTECAGEFSEVTFDVPVLSKHDERIQDAPFSPLYEGCSYHTNTLKLINDDYVSDALDDYENIVVTKAKPCRLNIGKLSILEAVNGLEYNSRYEKMEMLTSEGYPWVKQRPANASNKKWLFEFNASNFAISVNSDLTNALVEADKQRRQGIIQNTIFLDCLKDSKLPKEKVLIPGKTRVFSVSPIDFTISMRQYFMDFIVAFIANRFDLEHMIGIDIYSRECDIMINTLLSTSNNFIAGDYQKYGDKLYPVCVEGCFDVINAWYKNWGDANQDHATVRRVLGRELSSSIHLMGDWLYRCMCGSPSGSPITTIINTMVNSLYVRVVWKTIMIESKDLLHLAFSEMHKHICFYSFGDDLIVTVSQDLKHQFNAKTMEAVFSNMGIVFTNASKSGEMIEYSSIDSHETTFLKCTFSRHPFRNVWWAKMDKRVVEETSNWTWKTCADVQAASIVACKAELELSYGHGEEYYMNKRTRMRDYWRTKDVVFSAPTWKDIDARIYDQTL